MVSINIIAVGKLGEQYLKLACAEYSKRLGRHCALSAVEIKEAVMPENPTGGEIAKILEAEAERILPHMARGQNAVSVALCIEGKRFSSEGFSGLLSELSSNGKSRFNFIIGGSHGLSPKIKELSDVRLSVSDMTFPHQLMRVMLLEQLYRAFQIQSNSKYHK